MYWVYEIPNWLLFLLMTTSFAVVSLAGLLITRPVVYHILNHGGKHNDVTSYYISAAGVLYGLTLGLIAVGTWQNFSDVDSKVSKEANSLGALYRDLDGYPEPLRGETEEILREYVKTVIGKEWPAHQKGEILDAGDLVLEEFENKIMAFNPSNETEKIVHSVIIKSLADLVGDRGYRVQSVKTALPGVIWAVVLLGAVLNISLTFLFWIENVRLHSLLVVAFSVSLGMLIFLTVAMDNPFRGEFSVSPDAFKYVLDHVMVKAAH